MTQRFFCRRPQSGGTSPAQESQELAKLFAHQFDSQNVIFFPCLLWLVSAIRQISATKDSGTETLASVVLMKAEAHKNPACSSTAVLAVEG